MKKQTDNDTEIIKYFKSKVPNSSKDGMAYYYTLENANPELIRKVLKSYYPDIDK